MIPIRAYLAGGVLIALLAGGWYYGHTRYRAGERAEAGRNAAMLAKLADLTQKAAEAVRAREADVRKQFDALNTAREEGIANAVESQQKTVADLRDGNLRLRKQWSGCEAARAVSGVAGSVASDDGGAELRNEAAGRIVRVGADADAQVTYLQGVVRACQALAAPMER